MMDAPRRGGGRVEWCAHGYAVASAYVRIVPATRLTGSSPTSAASYWQVTAMVWLGELQVSVRTPPQLGLEIPCKTWMHGRAIAA